MLENEGLGQRTDISLSSLLVSVFLAVWDISCLLSPPKVESFTARSVTTACYKERLLSLLSVITRFCGVQKND